MNNDDNDQNPNENRIGSQRSSEEEKTDNENTRPSCRRTNVKSQSRRKRQVSNFSSTVDLKPAQTELNIHTRKRREASSRASAMIMQQNEIERSRFNYSMTNERSVSVNRRRRTKSTITNKDDSHTDVVPDPSKQLQTEPFKFNVPSIPPPPPPVPTTTNRKVTPPPSLSSVPAPASSTANVSNKTEYAQSLNAINTKSTNQLLSTAITSSNSKYPSLTETILAEHDRIHGTTPPYHTTKRDNLIKWVQELALYDCLSPPFPEHEIPLESFHGASSSISSATTATNDHIQSNRGIIVSQSNSNSNQSTSAATNNGGSIIGGAGSISTTVADTSTATTGGTTSNNTHSKSTAKATPLPPPPPPPPLLKQLTNTTTANTTVIQKNRLPMKGSNAVTGINSVYLDIKDTNLPCWF